MKDFTLGLPKWEIQDDKYTNRHTILYHANCRDGVAAAWVMGEYYDWGDYGDLLEFRPVQYGQYDLVELLTQIRGTHVVIVDFSFPRDEIEHIAYHAEGILLMDHHASAEREYADWTPPEETMIKVDLSQSGCQLAWNTTTNNQPLPKLLEHITDHDLWTHSDPNTRYVIAAIEHIKDVHEFRKLMERYPDGLGDYRVVDDLIRIGKPIVESKDRRMWELLDDVVMARFEGHLIPVVEASRSLTSHLGNLMLSVFRAPMAMVFESLEDGDIRVSLRADGQVDVSKLAEKYGGGGHRNAAGFIYSGPGNDDFLKNASILDFETDHWLEPSLWLFGQYIESGSKVGSEDSFKWLKQYNVRANNRHIDNSTILLESADQDEARAIIEHIKFTVDLTTVLGDMCSVYALGDLYIQAVRYKQPLYQNILNKLESQYPDLMADYVRIYRYRPTQNQVVS